jgi:hypothetical protein
MGGISLSCIPIHIPIPNFPRKYHPFKQAATIIFTPPAKDASTNKHSEFTADQPFPPAKAHPGMSAFRLCHSHRATDPLPLQPVH